MRLGVLIGVAAILLWPSDAWAWGPAAHVDHGLDILQNLALLPPALRALLAANRQDFLYGCCAADIVIGKNLARYAQHCHSWQTGLRVLDAAATPAGKAFAHGFLVHLAADVVAHNYFIPVKLVESFRALTARHTYWEVRFDKAALERPGVFAALNRTSRFSAAEHNRLMSAELAGSSRLFSIGTSRRIFSSMMVVSRLGQWQRLVAARAERSPLPLLSGEVRELRRLAIDAALALLIDGMGAPVVAADPTGARALRVARLLRRELRKAARRGELTEARWPALLDEIRGRLRLGLRGKLDLPPLAELLAAQG